MSRSEIAMPERVRTLSAWTTPRPSHILSWTEQTGERKHCNPSQVKWRESRKATRGFEGLFCSVGLKLATRYLLCPVELSKSCRPPRSEEHTSELQSQS